MVRGTVFILLFAFFRMSLSIELKVESQCPYPIWLATLPNYGISDLADGIVMLNSGSSYPYMIPNIGWAGRFWPKTGCDSTGYNCEFGDSIPPCPDGGCHPPADTKVEFNFPSQPPSQDSWYDISLVDGYSLPMKIVPRGINNGACVPTTCSMSLGIG